MKAEDNIGMILNASQATHGIDEEGILKNPFGKEVDFVKPYPTAYTAGKDNIDACYVGEIEDYVIVAFRGTLIDFKEDAEQAFLDWLNNFMAKPVSIKDIPGKLHDGFSSSVERLWEKGFYEEIEERMQNGKKLIVTGYSKGAALAPIAAAFLVERLNFDPKQMFLCYFEPPRPGDSTFEKYFNRTFPTAIRYEFQDDIVPHVPPVKFFSEKLANLPLIGKLLEKLEDIEKWDYKSVGKLHFVNWDNKIVDYSKELEADRIAHLMKLIKDRDIKTMIQDHMPCGHIYNVIVGTDCPK